jgi:type I restriction enzyme S subunit
VTVRFTHLPDGWARTRIDRVASVNARIGWKALTAAEYQPDGVVFLSTPNIKAADIDFENVNYISDWRYLESPELKLQVGDVILAKDGNTLGVTNLVRELPRRATVNGSIAVIRPRLIEPRFLRYTLAGDSIQGQIAALKAGMGVPHLFQWDIKRLPVLVPRPQAQNAIADFLDTETARIDALIAKKRRLIDSISRRLVLRAHDLVEEGERVLLRRLVSRVKTGTTPGGSDATVIDNEGEVEWLSPSDIGGWLEVSPAARRVRESARRQGIVPTFPAGSVTVVGIGATAGRVGVLDREASGNQQMTCLVPAPGVDVRFLAWQLLVRADELRETAPFTTLPILNNDYLKSVTVAVPEQARQSELASTLDALAACTTDLTHRLRLQIGLLQEHRQALITAAVTGEFDVPGVAA